MRQIARLLAAAAGVGAVAAAMAGCSDHRTLVLEGIAKVRSATVARTASEQPEVDRAWTNLERLIR